MSQVQVSEVVAMSGARRSMWSVAMVIPVALTGCAAGGPTFSPSAAPAASSPAVQPGFADQLRPKLLATLARLRTPGAIVLVDVPGQGTLMTALGKGNLDTGAAMQPDGHMRVGSITKTFTATVVLQLVDEHKLGLDDAVGRYLPQVPNGANITIRQLLDMTSGLFNITEDDRLSATLDAQPEKVWTNQELLDIAFAHPPYFPPGAGFHYSNTNYELLGMIAEQLGGAPLDQLMRKRIFDPLGMRGTLLPARDSTAIPEPHQRGYSWGTHTQANDAYKAALAGNKSAAEIPAPPGAKPADATNWSVSYTYASGAAISTAHDLLTWAKALVTGQLLSPQTQRERLALKGRNQYGLGIVREFGLTGHNGAISGYQSFMGYNPDKAITVIVLANLLAAPNTYLGDALPADTLARQIQQQVLPGQ